MPTSHDGGIPMISRNEMDDEDSDDSSLPSGGKRNGKWWYSTYHNVTAIVAAGVLGLPTAMVYLGWTGGAVVLAMAWVITLFTLWQMVQMHEMEDARGKRERIDTYYQLGQKAFGPKLGLWIVLPQQIIVQAGTNIVYMITGGEALWHFYQILLCPEIDQLAVGAGNHCCGRLGKTTFIAFYAIFQIILAQLENYNSIASLSLLASVTSTCYCSMAWIDALYLGKANHAAFEDPSKPAIVCPTSYRFSHDKDDIIPSITIGEQVFGVFSGLGVVAFAFAGHNVVLEIQASLPSTRKSPSKIQMWRGVMVAYFIVAICYFPVAFVGYWAFGTNLASRGASPGNPKNGNILLQLGRPRGLIAAANLLVAIHVCGSYQVYAMPMYELMETVLVRKFGFQRPQSGWPSLMRLVTRSTYVLFTAFVAVTFPFFNDLLAFFGGFALTPTTFFLPCIIWLQIKKPKAFSRSWLVNWALIVIGVLLTIVATTGGLRNIIVDASAQKRTFDYLNCTNTIQFPSNCTARHVGNSTHYTFYGAFTCRSSHNFESTTCKVHFE